MLDLIPYSLTIGLIICLKPPDTIQILFEYSFINSLFETTRLAKRQSAHLLNEFLPNVGSNIKNVQNGQLLSDNLVLRKFPTNKEIKDFKKIHRLV